MSIENTIVDDLVKKLHEEKTEKVRQLIEEGKQVEAGRLIFDDPLMLSHAMSWAIAMEDYEAAMTCVVRMSYLLDRKMKQLESIKPQGEA